MGAVEKLLEEHENRVGRLNMRANDPASGMTLGEYEDKLAALRAETAAKIAQVGSEPCEYCQGGKKIETEIDGEGYLLVYDADPEYHVEGFAVDAYLYREGEEDEFMLSFAVPRCPMCGREAGAR